VTLTFKANQANEGPDLAARGRGHRLHDQQSGQQPRGGYLLPHCRHDATRRTGDDDEGHGELTSHGAVGEPPPCQQCRHDRHCSITPCHAVTWAQDHDDNHTRTYADAKTRRLFLQAKFTSFPSLWLTTTQSENYWRSLTPKNNRQLLHKILSYKH
jgi:hypothetical protein